MYRVSRERNACVAMHSEPVTLPFHNFQGGGQVLSILSAWVKAYRCSKAQRHNPQASMSLRPPSFLFSPYGFCSLAISDVPHFMHPCGVWPSDSVNEACWSSQIRLLVCHTTPRMLSLDLIAILHDLACTAQSCDARWLVCTLQCGGW